MLVQQDIGRVLLNLFNNAFYAISEKAKTAGPDYKPEVTVTTAAKTNRLVITVKDNDTGIPDTIKENIMQPFVTTKPTGHGTGLGLSLSYDIVAKGHAGQFRCDYYRRGIYRIYGFTSGLKKVNVPIAAKPLFSSFAAL